MQPRNLNSPDHAQTSAAAAPIPVEGLEAAICAAVGERSFRLWFADKTHAVATADQLLIQVGSPFLLNWMQRHFRAELQEIAARFIGPAAGVAFEVNPEVAQPSSAQKTTDSAAPSKPDSSKSARNDPARRTSTAGPTDIGRAADAAVPRRRRFARLSEFVMGNCNDLAWTAARQVCDAPGEELNPLYLHGGAGTGKSHLLEGIYSQIRRSMPTLSVMYLTSETFTNYFTQALREHSLPGFRQRFRSVDVLLVDDIDFLDAKRGIQEEFLHTITQLQSHGRQVVVSADRHPRLLTKLSPELITRFQGGMVCRLEAPDEETRLRVVRIKAERMAGGIADDALEFVARRFATVRELEGALKCLTTYFHMTQRKVTLTAARRVLAELERDCIRIVNMHDIEKAVCDVFGVSTKALRSSSRQRSVSQPRMLAMYLARKHTQAAYEEIGRHFGGRNHSTVIAAEKRVKSWIQDGKVVRIASRSWEFSDLLTTVEERISA